VEYTKFVNDCVMQKEKVKMETFVKQVAKNEKKFYAYLEELKKCDENSFIREIKEIFKQ
jgi:hypothetical protein